MQEINLEYIQSLINEKSVLKLRTIFEEYNDVDIADIINGCSDKELLFIFKTIPSNLTSEVFSYLNQETQEKLINYFSNEDIGNILNNIKTDDIIDFIEEMPANLTRKILMAASKKTRSEINSILNYKEATAGAIMTTEYIELKLGTTCKKAIEAFKSANHKVRQISYLYIIDEVRNLVGVVHLRDLLIAESEDLVDKVMDADFVFTLTDTDQEEVSHLFKKYDINTLPVLNSDSKLVGVITVDDIIDVIEQEVTEDFHKMAAISPTNKEYLKTSVISITNSRIRWLLILMISATFTSLISGGFEHQLALLPGAISFYIPMLMDSAGNAGSQTTTTLIRALAVGEIKISDYLKVLYKEIRVGLLAGIVLAVTNFGWLILQKSIGIVNLPYSVAIVVSLALLATIVLAKTIGAMLPLLAKALKIDPALMAGPLLTTIVDALALIIYFVLAINLINI